MQLSHFRWRVSCSSVSYGKTERMPSGDGSFWQALFRAVHIQVCSVLNLTLCDFEQQNPSQLKFQHGVTLANRYVRRTNGHLCVLILQSHPVLFGTPKSAQAIQKNIQKHRIVR